MCVCLCGALLFGATPPEALSPSPHPAKLRGMQMVQHVGVEALHFNQTSSAASSSLFVWAERCPHGQVGCNLYASLVRNANALGGAV